MLMLNSLKLSDIAARAGGRLVGQDQLVTSVSTDTREALAGALFVALVGARFNGHAFIDQAVKQGALAVLVSEPCTVEPRIEVQNTTEAYGEIGRLSRDSFTCPVVAITGSNGKTSVKDWLADVLSNEAKVLKTFSNLNNQIGVPKTLLSASSDDKFAIIEAGTSFPGEIERLGHAIHGDVVVLTNASGSHLQGFGSIQGIAIEKGKLIETAKPDGVIILNLDDASYLYWESILDGRKCLTFSVENSAATLYAKSIKVSAVGSEFELVFKGASYPMRLDRPGRHHIANAMAVALAMVGLGYDFSDVVQRLEHPAQVPGRMEQIVTKSKALLINDCYNASPKSVEAAIDVVALFADQQKWVVLGALGELGELESSIHTGLGNYAAAAGIDRLITIGPIAELAANGFEQHGGAGVAHRCETKSEATELLASLNSDHVILVKGSRSAKMEDIVNALKD